MVLSLIAAPLRAAHSAPLAYAVNGCAGEYDCSHGTVSIIDTTASLVTATVAVGVGPATAAVSPDGSRVYVVNTCYLGVNYMCTPPLEGSVSVIDAGSASVVATIPVEWAPTSVAVSPSDQWVYVSDSLAYPNTVSVISTATDAVVRNITIPVGYGARGVVPSPDGQWLYVVLGACTSTECTRGHLAVVNALTGKVLAVTEVGQSPYRLAVSPDGSRVYVVNGCTNYGCTGNGTVSVIDTGTDRVVATVPVGNEPVSAAVSPDGSRLYVANDCVFCEYGSVSVIDTASNTVIGTIQIPQGDGYYPQQVTVSPDGSRVYVVNLIQSNTTGGANIGTVTVIDSANDTVLGAIPVGPSPFGIAEGPGALIASNSSVNGTPGEQLSGTVPTLTNNTACPTTDTLVQEPARGSLSFDDATGAWTYTPPSATYSGTGTFTWRGVAPMYCSVAQNPTKTVSNTATTVIKLHPQMSGLIDLSLKAGSSTTDNFNLAGSTPFRFTFASSDATVLSPAAMTLADPSCGADNNHLTCTLGITAAPALGTATVTITAIDPSGVAGSQSFQVTVTKPAPPTLTGLSNLTASARAASYAEPFTVSGVGVLAVTVTSSNSALLPAGNIIGTAACTAAGQCILKLKPVAQTTGTSTVTMTLTDTFGQSDHASFHFTIQPAASTEKSGGGNFGVEWVVLLAGLGWVGLRRRRLQH